MSFALSTVMDAIAAEMTTDMVAGTRTYAYPVPNPVPPCAIVGYPTELTYDLTFHALATTGKITAVFPVTFVVARVIDKDARDKLSAVITGAPGIKEALDGNLAGACDTCRTRDVTIQSITIGDTEYLAARFDLEVIA